MNPSLSPARIVQLTEFLSRRLGLDFPANRSADLELGIRAACRELGFHSADECVEWLATAVLTRAQIETLATHFTVGETYFFREPDVFATIQQEILPPIIRERRESGRRLRLWSAGCATGEEAYTLAIVVSRLLPDLQDWHVTILGTDIDARALRKAAAGVFSEWSFRTSTPGIKERYFESDGEHHYEIRPQLKKMVQFSYLNLAENAYPSLLTNTAAVDLILCRNVLLYFSAERAAEVRKRFYHSLLDNGWLIAGSAEHFEAPEFATVHVNGRFLFQKAKPQAEPPKPASAPVPPRSNLASPVRPPPPRESSSTGSRRISPAEQARAAANTGRLADALRHCEEAIRWEKLDPELHYLRASILTELGEFIQAEEELRRTLYIAPDFILAHFALAALTRRLGRIAEARRYLQNASAYLSQIDPDKVLPGSDGLTARIFDSHLRSLQSQVG